MRPPHAIRWWWSTRAWWGDGQAAPTIQPAPGAASSHHQGSAIQGAHHGVADHSAHGSVPAENGCRADHGGAHHDYYGGAEHGSHGGPEDGYHGVADHHGPAKHGHREQGVHHGGTQPAPASTQPAPTWVLEL